MSTIQTQSDQLLTAALQMPEKEFQQFITRLFTAKASQRVPALAERESELLLKINQGLTPNDAKRMKALITKRQSDTITAVELQELIRLTDESERLNVERLRHLLELAHLRGVTLDEVMSQLGIKPATA